MRKIKKVDSKLGQTVFSFACPCGGSATCSYICLCIPANAQATQKIPGAQRMNKSNGGSLVGGAG